MVKASRNPLKRLPQMRGSWWLLLLAFWSALEAYVAGSSADEDEDDALIVYDESLVAGGDAQCQAPPGPVMVKDVLAEIGHDVGEEVLERAVNALAAEGVVQTRQLLQLFPQDFDAVVMPLLLKSRLRRVRERGGRIPEDLIGHKKPEEDAEASSGEGADTSPEGDAGGNVDDIM
eukprot:TRINITY_DN26107_c0_g1_i1.p1 TRINITY_DN26107_c0_g1~~TRINITY_DN26107_c0_g1_i1.p1  ORF type:complete len:175 (-),score=42.45 TRINITY_DN26107_c0_g1_i1:87-611(-)